MSWIALPYPPTANHLFLNVPKRGRVMTPRYRAWREEAALLIRLAVRSQGLTGAYAMHVQAGRPDRRARDLSNLLKPIEDALVIGGAVRDDSDCERIEACWSPGLDGVRILLNPTRSTR